MSKQSGCEKINHYDNLKFALQERIVRLATLLLTVGDNICIQVFQYFRECVYV